MAASGGFLPPPTCYSCTLLVRKRMSIFGVASFRDILAKMVRVEKFLREDDASFSACMTIFTLKR